jgi:hypothetical protein
VVPRGAGRKLAGMDRRVSSDSLQLRVLTLCEADLPYIHSQGLTLYFPVKAEYGLSDFNVLYLKILLRSSLFIKIIGKEPPKIKGRKGSCEF